MPGYARPTSIFSAAEVSILPTGDISASNLQDALVEIASEKATVSSVTTVQNNLNTVNTNLSSQISSVEGVALLGL
jgi:hypothetical protein